MQKKSGERGMVRSAHLIRRCFEDSWAQRLWSARWLGLYELGSRRGPLVPRIQGLGSAGRVLATAVSGGEFFTVGAGNWGFPHRRGGAFLGRRRGPPCRWSPGSPMDNRNSPIGGATGTRPAGRGPSAQPRRERGPRILGSKRVAREAYRRDSGREGGAELDSEPRGNLFR